MKSEAWSGLITHASKFALPLGAATEQVNFHNAIPGQLTSRDGMGEVLFVGEANSTLDCCAVQIGERVSLLALTQEGLAAISYPTHELQYTPPQVPAIDSSNGTTTSYLWQYASGDFVTADEPDDDDSPFLLAIDGGTLGVSDDPPLKCIDAEAHCGQTGTLSVFDGGTSTTSVYPVTIKVDEICDCEV